MSYLARNLGHTDIVALLAFGRDSGGIVAIFPATAGPNARFTGPFVGARTEFADMIRSLAAYGLLLADLLLAAASLTYGCDGGPPGPVTKHSGERTMAFTLHTTAFSPGGDIPARYTCSGADISPQLSWSDPPPGTQAFALIVDDPDAPSGTFTHWLLFNVGPQEKELREDVPKTEQLPNGASQGRNDFRKIGYGGPCPPPGKSHRYFFRLYAIDRKINLKSAATRHELESSIKGHILAQAELMGKFKR